MRKLLKITLCAALALILTSSTPTVPDATCDASPRPTNEAVYRHNTDKKRVALTFDDGPHYKYTAEILDILDEYGAKATFFVVGELAERYPELILRELAEGHEIGNHTWAHSSLPTLNREKVKKTLTRTQEQLDKVLGYHYPMQLMRPPYGNLSSKKGKKSDMWVVESIYKAGYVHAVRWDVDTTDAKKALKNTQNGSILLFHANAKDVRCLTKLIPNLLDKGFECLTLSTLLGLEDPVPEEAQTDAAGV